MIPAQTFPETPAKILQDFDSSHGKVQAARREIGRFIIGQERVVDLTLISLLSGGHVLLVGVPGLAKTLLARTTAAALGLTCARVQCTPDLMPADILGSEVLDKDEQGKRHFRFIKGPVFSQILMADEINRASPRTQSALLQAMQEYEVSIGGQTYPLPKPFHVLATQNPIEHEGTYPLPEAQLDRFIMQISVDYPDGDAERRMLLATGGAKTEMPAAALQPDELLSAQSMVRAMPIGEKVLDGLLALVRSLRPGESASSQVNEHIHWAPGPRGAQALMLAVRAQALLDGRESPSLDDVAALAVPVLSHRMALHYAARAQGITAESLIRDAAQKL